MRAGSRREKRKVMRRSEEVAISSSLAGNVGEREEGEGGVP